MSSVASTRSDFASCATSSPSSRSGLGETTTSSPAATAIRSVSAATPSGPAPRLGASSSRQGTSTPVGTSDAAAGSASSSSSTRFSRLRNSKRRNISFSCERSGGESTTSAGSKSSSRSRRIVASSFAAFACSACSRIDFERAGVSSSTCSSTSSSEPYWAISWPAVLSPIPGTPGMLSEGSPFRPMKSGTCSGLIPSRSSTRSGV